MLLEDVTEMAPAQLEQAIERHIVRRTWGRVHRLHVQVIENRVIIHGCTSSYYVKQLALEGVLDVLGSEAATRVELDIQVGLHPRKHDEAPLPWPV